MAECYCEVKIVGMVKERIEVFLTTNGISCPVAHIGTEA
jgi:hypothetical protein